MVRVPRRQDIAEAARLLRRLVELVERGDLDTSSGPAVALVRHLEGAAIALETASK